MRLSGRGLGLDLEGEGLPLVGRLDLHPFRLAYRYAGALPLGLGELRAEGVYPGAWLSGTYRYGEAVLALEGLPGFRVGLSGEGVRGEVGVVVEGGIGREVMGGRRCTKEVVASLLEQLKF